MYVLKILLAICVLAGSGLYGVDFKASSSEGEGQPSTSPSVYPTPDKVGPPHFTYLPAVATNGSAAPTSGELIDEALARGDIDQETALVYHVYAVYADERLPDEYRGDDSMVIDSMVMAEVLEQFDSLSPAAQAVLEPFLLPPSAPGSWLELREAGKSPMDTQAPGAPAIQWGKVWAVEDKIKVWYQQRHSDTDLPNALLLADEIAERIYPQLQALMERPLLPDDAFPNHGDDGALDVYLVHGFGAKGQAVPYGGCYQVPSYVLIDSSKTSSHRSTTAHEFMHVYQFLYNNCSEYCWLAEATAKWAEDFVYGRQDQAEHAAAPWYLHHTEERLDLTDYKHEYGAYVFFFYLTKRFANPTLIRTIWQNTERQLSLEAVNQAVPGGFAAVWKEFATYNWNEPPLDKYREWDDLQAKANYTLIFTLGPGVFDIEVGDSSGGIDYLTIEYYKFLFSEESERMVTFFNGLTYDLSTQDIDVVVDSVPIQDGSHVFGWEAVDEQDKQGAGVQALIRLEGSDQWQVEDWTDKPVVSFCRDKQAERVQELVLIFTNSNHEPTDPDLQPANLNPKVQVSDIGCWRWEGAATHTVDILMEDPPGSPSFVIGQGELELADIVWERQETQPEGSYPYVNYELKQASWSWTSAYAYRDCWGEGHGSGSTDGSLAQGPGVFHTFQGVLSGPSKSRYQGGSSMTVDFDDVGVCDGEPFQQHLSLPMMWFVPNELMLPEEIPKVQSNGATIDDTASDEHIEQEWRFEARRE